MSKILNSLVTSGSAGNFAKQLGAWIFLEPIIKPEILVSTSGSTFVTAMIALDFTINEMKRTLRDLDIASLIDPYMFSPISLIQEDKLAFIKGAKIYKKLKELFPYKLKETKYPMVITATDITNKRLKLFGSVETPEVYLYDAIRATISLPVIFTPHIIDGIQYIDGGISENFYLKYFPKEKGNVIGLRMVDKPIRHTNKITSIQDMVLNSIFIPIVKNEEKNIEDSPKSKIVNLISSNTSYEFEKLNYNYILTLINEGYNETANQWSKYT